jgi:hypothetical protein
MTQVQTIKVAHPTIADDYMVINATDYNPALHTLFDDSAKKKGKAKKQPAASPLPGLEGAAEEQTEPDSDETNPD